jgi:hypothetical protein
VHEETRLNPKTDPVHIAGAKGNPVLEGVLYGVGGYRGDNGEWYTTFSVRAPNRKTLSIGFTKEARDELLRRWGITDAIEKRLKETRESMSARMGNSDELGGYSKALEFVLQVITKEDVQ